MSETRDPDPAPDGILSPGARISPDTHVGTRLERVPPGVSTPEQEPRPEALVDGNRVTRAEDMEDGTHSGDAAGRT